MMPFLAMIAYAAAASPALVASIRAMMTREQSWTMAAIVVGTLNAALALGLGLWWAGRDLDRRGPEVLAKIQSFARAQ